MNRRRNRRRPALGRILFLLVSLAMMVIACIGVYGIFTAPAKAKAARAEVEAALKEKQKIEEAKRNTPEARQKRLEEGEPVGSVYDDASEVRLCGVGDSVMLASIDALYAKFPNGSFDAEFGRTLEEGIGVVQDLVGRKQTGDVVLLSLFTNDPFTIEKVNDLILPFGDEPIFIPTVYGVGMADDNNAVLRKAAQEHDNVYLIEWQDHAKDHVNDWIMTDGFHPNEEGARAYAQLVYETIEEDLFEKEDR